MLIPKSLRNIGIKDLWQIPMVMPQYTNNMNVISDFRLFFDCLHTDSKILCCGILSSYSETKYMPNKASYITVQILDVNGVSLQANVFGTKELLTSIFLDSRKGDVVHMSGKPLFQRGAWLLHNAKVLDQGQLYRIHTNYVLNYKNKSLPTSSINFITEHIESMRLAKYT